MLQASCALLTKVSSAMADTVTAFANVFRMRFRSMPPNMKRVGTGLILLAVATCALTLWFAQHHELAVAVSLIAGTIYALSLLRALARKSRELELTLNHMTQGIMMVDRHRNVPVINRRRSTCSDCQPPCCRHQTTFEGILSFQQTCEEFGKDGIAVEPKVWDFIKQGGASTSVPLYERVRPNGTALEIRTVPLPDGGLVRTYTDVTERKRAEGEVRAMALRDELTGLANRARLHEHLHDAFRRLHSDRRGFLRHQPRSRPLEGDQRYPGPLGRRCAPAAGCARLLGCVEKTDLVARVGTDKFSSSMPASTIR